ncbi:hypothetical protein HYALB_00000478 [Hymenoscyphus albidus]|uniref:Oxidoreductase n=1 Tax=Hymenoscyphus albidus TaxID=595503 RepID=A0A9N9PTU7_9HELO|nr:hypothetical protein HYALB_00000478 [Hymenoscyphus albidus]
MSLNKEKAPDLAGKVIFITGGTAGIGAETLRQLSKQNPAHIFFTGRDSERASTLIQVVNQLAPKTQLTFLECDHGSLSTVKSAAERFIAASTRLDILICNAGIMAEPTGLTKDRYEVQFGVNHMAHALFMKKLLPTLQQTAGEPDADVRILLLTSISFRFHPTGGICFDELKTTQDLGVTGAWLRYGQSKLANAVYARELDRRFPEILSISIHPGIVKTNLVGNLGFFDKAFVYLANFRQLVDTAHGAHNTLWAATSDRSKIWNGQMYDPVGKLTEKLNVAVQDDGLATRLWEWTDKELEGY